MQESAAIRRFPYLNFKGGARTRGMYLLSYRAHRKASSFRTNISRGGVGIGAAAAYINYEFERIFYKINYGYRATIQSLYMVSTILISTEEMS
jgi:hypothetical protein